MDLKLATLTLAAALSASCAAFFVSCSAPNVVRVGIDPSRPPMEYRQDDDSLVGFDLDLIRAIGKVEGFKPEFVVGSWPGLFAQAESGGLLAGLGHGLDVVCSSAYITSERRVEYRTTQPYLDAGQILVVPWDAPARSLDDLTKSTVGVIEGSKGHDAVRRLFRADRDQLRLYQNTAQALDDLLERRIGGVVAGRLDIAAAFAGDEALKAGLRLTGPVLTDDETLGIFVSKNDAALQAKLDDGLAKLRASGQYEELLDRWALR